MIRPLQRVSSDIARPAGTRCSRSPISCRPPPTRQPRRRCALPPPDFPHFKHVCTPTVLASLAPAAPTASSAVLNYTLASSTACAASASPSLQACAHPVLPHLHFLKRVSTDPTFALRAPFAPAAFLPHLHLLKHVPNDTTLALMAPASACEPRSYGYFSSPSPSMSPRGLFHKTHPSPSCSLSFSLRVLRHLRSLKVPPAASAWVQLRTLPLLQTRVHRHDTRPPGTRSSRNLSVCALPHLEARVHRYHARPSRTSCSHSFHLRVPPHPCLFKRVSANKPPAPRHQLLPQPQLTRASAPLRIQARVHRHNTTPAFQAPAAPSASARVVVYTPSCSNACPPSRRSPTWHQPLLQLQLACASAPFTSSSACPPTRRWPSRHAPAAPAASSCVCFRTFIHHLLPRLQLARASASSSTCPPTRHSPTRHPHAASADSTCLCLRTFAYSSACPPTRRSPSWHPLLPQIVCAAAPSLLHTCVHQHDTHPHGTSCCRSFSLRVLRHLCSLKVAPAASACV